jgi:PhzF family phenazine biosynthesis protein
MGIPLLQVDAFAHQPFTGNPAAVCVLEPPVERPIDASIAAAWMQRVAAEMNLSETAFVYPEADRFRLRWFTPTVEVDLCGHATLATAHVLWQLGSVPPTQSLQFETRSGLLSADLRDGWIELNFPAKPPHEIDPPEDLMRSLGISSQVSPHYVGFDGSDYLIEVDSEATVRALQPDFSRLARFPVRGTIVTSRIQDQDYDFVSRFFAPAAGINEDPVTGSAHCCLTPFWQQRLDRSELVAYQASARGGFLRVRLEGDRVVLAGQAITVFQGELSPAALPY